MNEPDLARRRLGVGLGSVDPLAEHRDCTGGVSPHGDAVEPEEGPDNARVEEAQALFARGDEAAQAGRSADAARFYTRSLALFPLPSTALNLAIELDASGRPVAARSLTMALVAGDCGGAPSSLVRTRAEALLTRVRDRVATLHGRVEAPPRTTVRLDGEVVSDVDASGVFEVDVDPGRHVVLARAPSGEIVESVVVVGEGESHDVALRLELAGGARVERAPLIGPGSEQATGAQEVDGGGLFSRPAFYIVLGILVAGAAAAIVTVAVLDSNEPSDPVWGSASLLVGRGGAW